MTEQAILKMVRDVATSAPAEIVPDQDVAPDPVSPEPSLEQSNNSKMKEPPLKAVEVVFDKSASSEPAHNNYKEALDELDTLVEHDGRVSRIPLDTAELRWDGASGRFSVEGLPTRLALILGSMVIALSVVVYTKHDVNDAYIPMSMLGALGLLISYMEREKK